MFGYVIQIRDTFLVLAIVSLILYALVLSRTLAVPTGTDARKVYDTIYQFAHYMLLIPGILFLVIYLFFVLRVKYSAGKITSASKRIRKERASEQL